MSCPHHPGVGWNPGLGSYMVDGHVLTHDPLPCFVCHPYEEAEGTTEHLLMDDLAPHPTDYMPPASRLCVVLTDPASEVPCKGTSSTRTVLGWAICDSCWEAASL